MSSLSWQHFFKIQTHAVHKDHPRSKILILTQNKESDEKLLRNLNFKEAKFDVIDITNHNDQSDIYVPMCWVDLSFNYRVNLDFVLFWNWIEIKKHLESIIHPSLHLAKMGE